MCCFYFQGGTGFSKKEQSAIIEGAILASEASGDPAMTPQAVLELRVQDALRSKEELKLQKEADKAVSVCMCVFVCGVCV